MVPALVVLLLLTSLGAPSALAAAAHAPKALSAGHHDGKKRTAPRKLHRPLRVKAQGSKAHPRRAKKPTTTPKSSPLPAAGKASAAPAEANAPPQVSPPSSTSSPSQPARQALGPHSSAPAMASPATPTSADEATALPTAPAAQSQRKASLAPPGPPVGPVAGQATAAEQAAFALVERRADGALAAGTPVDEAFAAEDATPPVDGVDLDRWVLQDVLDHGPGQSIPWEKHLGSQEHAPYTEEAAVWQQRLAAKRAALALAGAPQTRRDVVGAADAFDIPLQNHPLVDLYIDYFTGRGRWFFARWLERSATLIPLMQEILTEHGLPKDLVYLAMVESGFSAHAVSLAAASGYWQFIPSTGALFGLKQDRFVDERRDFVRATEAAGKFLHSLHGHFGGDWHLAWASYNAGEARIRRAMAKTGAQTFWELIDRPHGLAKETVHYVPKIIAAAIVAKDPARYGFAVPVPNRLSYDQVTIDGALDVNVLAKRMHTPVESLRALNPALLYDLTPPDRRTRLRVPKGTLALSEAALAALPKAQRLQYVAYKVQRGDTLSGIARRMHASADTLRTFNRLTSTRLRLGQELVVPSALVGVAAAAPTKRAAPASASKAGRPTLLASAAAAVTSSRQPPGRLPKARHVVASGDTLWSIARRYGVNLETLGRRGAKATRLAVGDVVDIF